MVNRTLEPSIQLGLRENWQQFTLLVLINAFVGAMIGLALPTHIVQIALGGTILGICVLMLVAKKSEYPDSLRSYKNTT